MKKGDIKRAELLRIVNLVRPALSKQDYIKELKHIRFAGGFATAFDDITCISVAADLGVERCVPGEMLAKSLASMSAETVSLSIDADGVGARLSSGRSKIKLPTLPVESFPYDPAPHDTDFVVELGDDMLRGIELCLMSVGADKSHPESMGVTMYEGADACAVFYSTDNYTISRYVTSEPVALQGEPVFLPTFFCEQVIALSKAFPDARLYLSDTEEGWAVAFEGPEGAEVARLTTKTMLGVQAVPFPDIVRKHYPKGGAGFPVPDAMDAAIERAALMQSSEPVKTTTVTVEAKSFALDSSSDLGTSDDVLEVDSEQPLPAAEFKVDPSLVARALKLCVRMEFAPRVLVLGDRTGKFTHIVSHVVA